MPGADEALDTIDGDDRSAGIRAPAWAREVSAPAMPDAEGKPDVAAWARSPGSDLRAAPMTGTSVCRTASPTALTMVCSGQTGQGCVGLLHVG